MLVLTFIMVRIYVAFYIISRKITKACNMGNFVRQLKKGEAWEKYMNDERSYHKICICKKGRVNNVNIYAKLCQSVTHIHIIKCNTSGKILRVSEGAKELHFKFVKTY